MSRFVRDLIKQQASQAIVATAPARKPGPVSGVSKPKPLDPDTALAREILGRALVFRINNEMGPNGHEAAKALICAHNPTFCGERWNRVMSRRIYAEIGTDLMIKVCKAAGLEPFRAWALYQSVADEMGVELNADTIDDVDIKVMRRKLATRPAVPVAERACA